MVSSLQPGAPGRTGARLVALPSPTLAQADDGTLARAASAGDPRATGVLWDRFSPLVRRVLRRTLGPHAEVESLLQSVFVRVIEQVGTLSESSQLRQLVLGVTVRVLNTELRRRRLRRLFRLRSPWHASELVAADATARSALTSLYRILDGLDPDARLAFTLRHFEGLPVTELAAATDASVPTIKRRLARAGARVRAALGTDAALRAYATAASLGDAP